MQLLGMRAPGRFHVLAALTLIDMDVPDVDKDDVRRSTLLSIRPMLTGEIAAAVDDGLPIGTVGTVRTTRPAWRKNRTLRPEF